MAGNRMIAAIDHQGRALLHAEIDVALDARTMLLRDQRAHVHARRHAVADLERTHAWRQLGDQRVGGVIWPTGTATEIAMQRSPAEP